MNEQGLTLLTSTTFSSSKTLNHYYQCNSIIVVYICHASNISEMQRVYTCTFYHLLELHMLDLPLDGLWKLDS